MTQVAEVIYYAQDILYVIYSMTFITPCIKLDVLQEYRVIIVWDNPKCQSERQWRSRTDKKKEGEYSENRQRSEQLILSFLKGIKNGCMTEVFTAKYIFCHVSLCDIVERS